ncbi:MAG TPA: hypothetical protein VJK52_00015 [Candidatus Nanoarchaeia archaeon]|nr:hypothetical protein [Candidatus Nanoarchaeia archaeon]
MAKKTEGFLTTAIKALSNGLLGKIRDTVEGVVETVQEKAYETYIRITQELYVFFFVMIAVVFLLVGFVFLLREKLFESMGVSFLLVGFVVLVIVLLYRSTLRR